MTDDPFPLPPADLRPLQVEGSELSELGRLPDYFWEVPDAETLDNPAVYCVSPIYAADGRMYAAIGGGDDKISVLEMTPSQEGDEQPFRIVRSFPGIHTDSIARCGLSADKSMLAAASLDGKVSVYKVTLASADHPLQVEHVNTLEGPGGEIEDCCWSPKGFMILATCSDNSAWLWHAVRGFHGVLLGHSAPVTHGAFVHCEVNGKEEINVVTASLDGAVIIWDPNQVSARHNVHVAPLEDEEGKAISCMCAHPTEPVIAVGTVSGQVCLVQASTGQVVQRAQVGGTVTDVKLSPSVTRAEIGEMQLAAADEGGVVHIYDCSTFAKRTTLTHPDVGVSINHICWGPSWPPTLVTATEDGLVRKWDPRNGELKDTLIGGTGIITDLRIFPVASPPVLLVGATTEEGGVLAWQL
eukprot:Blabericola_migrator_1__4775@NODE_2511_length_2658_cov_172_582787_g1572_i0_p1_GENE_NODE_2511_length_2658_cov_172_582787_g1572_i0NODE_2511_length_2658_cov_172_582787_g1572_i0_p1_ORF_typecomplete_len412_score85_06ANAPC4_WD40/PF12894_7/0_021ANAPC4_WD40/PF12894_7/1_3e07ANAPC4_WD40/PF12894_7/1e08ANAPC4_WD40/PF12894_7/0_043ANAPC4_WD40/PF12894_7/0_0001WD40_like/PF17005_5/1_5e21WD40/PF00400_32/3_8e03WD40/PF00400_32/0_096WD40/PF00400_32/0_00049WD40/PF00400_32/0_033WD40/PF00400_32/2e02WD40/PF00400_32/5e02